jgi:hypothetical protein
MARGEKIMDFDARDLAIPDDPMEPVSIATLTHWCQPVMEDQVRSFELLRLAFFALKLRKLEREKGDDEEYAFHCSLLRHVIFQQVVTLTTLNAREQALQLISTCRYS